jgi:flagellum-specific peptidoglycan hydrolase FlgJ
MNLVNKAWLENAADEATTAAHIFPAMAACEAALESNFGKSELAIEGNNLFGMKAYKHEIYGTLTLPTKEYEHSEWVVVDANWVKYPTLAACFSDRMATLVRLEHAYPHYAAALAATDPVTYVTEVSRNWSSDPARAVNCEEIYNEYFG